MTHGSRRRNRGREGKAAPVNVWLIKDGENLPIQSDARRMRTWMLAEELLRQGHQATWWASTHSHQRKVLLFDEDREVEVAQGFRLKLLFAGAYRSNRSLGRLLHHSRLAAKFRRLAPTLPRPDVIVSAFPTIELAFEAVEFAGPRRIPVIIDIRDPWPDILLDLAPPIVAGSGANRDPPAGAESAHRTCPFRQSRCLFARLP